MGLSDKEKKTLLRTQIRNMKRKYAKLTRHPEFAEDCIDLFYGLGIFFPDPLFFFWKIFVRFILYEHAFFTIDL